MIRFRKFVTAIKVSNKTKGGTIGMEDSCVGFKISENGKVAEKNLGVKKKRKTFGGIQHNITLLSFSIRWVIFIIFNCVRAEERLGWEREGNGVYGWRNVRKLAAKCVSNGSIACAVSPS